MNQQIGKQRNGSKKMSRRGSSMASINATTLLPANQTNFKQCRTHGSFIKNFAGWMKIQSGFLGLWKQCFFTLQGIEFTVCADEGLPPIRCGTIEYVVSVKGKPNVLEFHMKSKKVWKTQCISNEIANAWLTAIDDAMGRLSYGIERYFKSCEKKQIQTTMCGWLSHLNGRQVVSRYFYVLHHLTLSIAPNVDIQPEVYDIITGITAAEQDGAMELRFKTQPSMILQCDSVDLLRLWHLITRTCINESIQPVYC